MNFAERGLIVDRIRPADDRAVGQGRHCGLQVENLCHRNRDHPGTPRLEVSSELSNAIGIGAAAEADVDRGANLQNVAAVQGSRRLDARDLVPEAANRLADGCGLGLTARRTGQRDHSEPAVHHDRVLDEHSVGAVVGWRHFDDGPAVTAHGIDVAVPLRGRHLDVDIGAFEVRQQTLGQAWARSANQSFHAGRLLAKKAMVLAHAALAAVSL